MSYPNMSYCAAENTLNAINQLVDLIQEGEKDEAVKTRDKYEYYALKNIVHEAKLLSEITEDLLDKYAN